ncbi:hypothetical protein BJY01DRAFT_215553 [Aspergillus pseudoustus]|uniref:Translation initiation factor IF-2, mitochondrial n=1 Tax=Aspergillus pseudoustus TaxID=1810923 RepID=A0ABR4JV26_9EURO
MHRRTIVQLSRCHGAEWHRTARLRDTVARPPRRRFHPSPSNLDSSDPPSTDDADAAGNASAFPKATPKFGARWGSKATKPAALSPEEQALRKALMDKTAKEQEKQRHAESLRESLRRQRSNNRRSAVPAETGRQRLQTQPPLITGEDFQPRKNTYRDWICPNCQYNCFGKHSFCPQCGSQKQAVQTRSAPRSMRSQDWTCPKCSFACVSKLKFCPKCTTKRPPLETSSPRRERIDPELRAQDWTCPSCHHLCFGKHMTCPKCTARRPVPNKFPSKPTEEIIGESIKIRKLTPPPPDAEMDEEGPRELALQKHIANRQNSAERQKQKSNKTDTWTWDPSSLDNIQIDSEVIEQSKTPRRRGGRRMPENEDQGGKEFDEEEYRQRREERKRLKKEKQSQQADVEPAMSPLYLPEFISVSNFADVIGVRPAQFVERLEEMGFEDVSYSHILDAETSGLIAAEFGFEPFFDTGAEYDLAAAPEPEDKSIWPSRPPVVTIMGHVDHGKTTILDWLRKSSVAASEHGGITQHIGAFSVSMPSGKTITFLDTPGHAAFLDMRRRGADVTDIVVLVVAADDSVKPQTIEAIKHATSAGVPIIVAISKIDKPGVNPEKVKQDLAVQDIHVEDYGGDVQAIGVSGKTGEGMLELEEAIITLSEVLDHRADRDGAVEGWVVEGTTKSYGRVATMLVRRGTLRQGDVIVAGTTWARVRTLRNEAGVTIPEATPGMPVQVDGWREQPEAGMEFLQAEDEQRAKEVVDYRQERVDIQKLGEDTTAINESRQRQREASEGDLSAVGEAASGPKPVHFVLKADVGGSAEAVLNSVTAIGNNEVYANVLRSEVGPISEFDIEHADAAGGRVINFNMPIDPTMLRLAEAKGVAIMDHNIIYKLVDEVKDILSEQLPPRVTQRVTGEAEIGQIFEISLKRRSKTTIAGCKVRNGVINRTRKVRVLRGQETVYDGTITSLRNVKKDVAEMRKDTECGIAFENWTEFAVGDQIQCYEEILEKRSL